MNSITLILPNYAQYDTLIKSPLPFGLWQVGDLPLLYHWLDFAINQGASSVNIISPDRPNSVRQYMEEATLWPLKWNIITDESNLSESPYYTVCSIPGSSKASPLIQSDWELIEHWQFCIQEWLNTNNPNSNEASNAFSVGRFCSIHPTVKLRMPVWIGDYVSVGPGCVIGPNAVINEGCILEGPSSVKHAAILPNTFLAGNTELNNAILIGSMLINLKYKACIDRIDSRIATPLNELSRLPGIWERLAALCLYAVFCVAAAFTPKAGVKEWRDFNGLSYLEYDGPLWLSRRHYLLHVWNKKMRLLGILPRTQEDLEKLPQDWRNIIMKLVPGVYSYADLMGCHSPNDQQEPIHAIYQATQKDHWINWRLVRKFVSLIKMRGS